MLGLLLVAVLVAPPIVILPGLREPFRLPKELLSELLALSALTAGSWWWWRRSGDLAWRPLAVAVVPFGVVVALSASLSRHPEHAWIAVRQLAAVGALGVAAVLFQDRDQFRRRLDWLIVPGCVLAGLGLLEALSWFEPIATVERGRHGIVSLAGNVADLGAYLVLPALLAQARLASRVVAGRFDRISAGWLLVILLLAAPILIGQVLTATAALGLASLVLWSLRLGRRRAWIVLSVCLVGIVLAMATPIRERAVEEVRALRAGGWNEVLTGRLDGWRAGWWIGREHQLLGAGPGAYRTEFVPAKLELLGRGVSFYAGHGARSTFANAHNEVVELFAELGIAGLGAVVWLAWTIARRSRDLPPSERAFGAAALAAFVVLSLAYFPTRIALVGYPWAMVFAWPLAARELPRPPEKRSRGWRRLAAVVLVGGLAALTVAAAGNALARLRANRVLFVAETEAALPTTPALRTRLRRNAIALRDAFATETWDARLPLAIGSHHLLLGETSQAVDWYRRSLSLEPRPETYLNLGRALWAEESREQALEAFGAAVALTPALRRQVPLAARDALPERSSRRRHTSAVVP